jgi:hypothetical protein
MEGVADGWEEHMRRSLIATIFAVMALAAGERTAWAGALDTIVQPNGDWGATDLVPSDYSPVQDMAAAARNGDIPDQGGTIVRLFEEVQADSAMNGHFVHIAFMGRRADGWSVFDLGDFLDYRILSAAPRRVDLEIHENIANAAGELSVRMRRMSITWPALPDGARPELVTVTPIR